MLSARTAGSIGVDAEVGLIDVHFDGLIHLGVDKDGSKGCVAARVGIEGGDPHQTVDTGLGLQVPVGIVPFHREGHALGPCLLAGLIFQYFCLIPSAVSPTEIHSEQHLGPVLGLSAASSRVKAHNGVSRVVGSAQDLAELDLGKFRGNEGYLRRGLFQGLFTFFDGC